MSALKMEEIPTGVESKSADPRIIRLPITWSDIPGLVPPLSKDAIETIKQEFVVQDAFIDPQWIAILKDAQDRFLPKALEGIGFRAIMVSDEGTVHLTTNGGLIYDVPDINTVLEKGGEIPGKDIRVSRQTEREDEIRSTSHSRVGQYLIKAVGSILNGDEIEARKKLSPAVLIYDLSQLEYVSGYTHKLKYPADANKAILGIYLLDIEPAK